MHLSYLLQNRLWNTKGEQGKYTKLETEFRKGLQFFQSFATLLIINSYIQIFLYLLYLWIISSLFSSWVGSCALRPHGNPEVTATPCDIAGNVIIMTKTRNGVATSQRPGLRYRGLAVRTLLIWKTLHYLTYVYLNAGSLKMAIKILDC